MSSKVATSVRLSLFSSLACCCLVCCCLDAAAGAAGRPKRLCKTFEWRASAAFEWRHYRSVRQAFPRSGAREARRKSRFLQPAEKQEQTKSRCTCLEMPGKHLPETCMSDDPFGERGKSRPKPGSLSIRRNEQLPVQSAFTLIHGIVGRREQQREYFAIHRGFSGFLVLCFFAFTRKNPRGVRL